MANYPIDNTQYTESIRALERGDKADAIDVFNPLFQKLINNTAYLKSRSIKQFATDSQVESDIDENFKTGLIICDRAHNFSGTLPPNARSYSVALLTISIEEDEGGGAYRAAQKYYDFALHTEHTRFFIILNANTRYWSPWVQTFPLYASQGFIFRDN